MGFQVFGLGFLGFGLELPFHEIVGFGVISGSGFGGLGFRVQGVGSKGVLIGKMRAACKSRKISLSNILLQGLGFEIHG